MKQAQADQGYVAVTCKFAFRLYRLQRLIRQRSNTNANKDGRIDHRWIQRITLEARESFPYPVSIYIPSTSYTE